MGDAKEGEKKGAASGKGCSARNRCKKETHFFELVKVAIAFGPIKRGRGVQKRNSEVLRFLLFLHSNHIKDENCTFVNCEVNDNEV